MGTRSSFMIGELKGSQISGNFRPCFLDFRLLNYFRLLLCLFVANLFFLRPNTCLCCLSKRSEDPRMSLAGPQLLFHTFFSARLRRTTLCFLVAPPAAPRNLRPKINQIRRRVRAKIRKFKILLITLLTTT